MIKSTALQFRQRTKLSLEKNRVPSLTDQQKILVKAQLGNLYRKILIIRIFA